MAPLVLRLSLWQSALFFWQQKKKNGEMAPLNRSLVRLTSLADLAVSILLLLLPLLLLLVYI